LALYAELMPSLAEYRMRPFSRHWDEIGHILRLGLPIGGILGLEIGVFATAGILMGLLGADALAAHQLVMNCISVVFMVPLGIAQAATVRVAVALGSGMPGAARRAGFVAIALGAAYMAIMAVVLVAAPRTIARIYVDIDAPANRGLVEIALYLLWRDRSLDRLGGRAGGGCADADLAVAYLCRHRRRGASIAGSRAGVRVRTAD
jgi:MATE family multidrug resistance protein